ncbi:MAG: YHYH domain-containing protein [Nitrospinota bacterium]|nr:YHYH domain-containing protein [Nitrospinota bacterium]MDH5511397.1 YHYH domain-containing protein [Nitrospinota bacterium]
MKRLLAAILAVSFLVAVAAPFAMAHSGRTNSSGCHTNKKTGEYHCH